MRFFAIAADVFLGLVLGIFVNAVIIGTWPSLRRPSIAAIVILISVILVLFRRPNGSLARWSERH